MTQTEKKNYAKAIEAGKMKMFDLPFVLPDKFIEKWKSQSNERAEKNIFIDIQKTEAGCNILSIGNNPEFALFLVGIAFGAYNRA